MWKVTQVLFFGRGTTYHWVKLWITCWCLEIYYWKAAHLQNTFWKCVCECVCDVQLLVYSICKWSLFTLTVFVLTFNFALMNMNVVVQVLLNSHSLFISCCAVTEQREMSALGSYLHSGKGAFYTDCTLHQCIWITFYFNVQDDTNQKQNTDEKS